MRIFHLATQSDWAAAQSSGAYTTSTFGVTLEQEGFLHCSRDSQVRGVLSRYYATVAEPITLLVIDTDPLASPWQLDDVPGADLTYPHIYGPLNPAAVVAAMPLARDAAGEWEVPTLPAST